MTIATAKIRPMNWIKRFLINSVVVVTSFLVTFLVLNLLGYQVVRDAILTARDRQ